MVRGAGKYKVRRGGGRAFSRDLFIDENGTAVSAARRQRRRRGRGEEEEEEKGPLSVPGESEISRAERRELKKKQAASKPGANEDGDGGGDDGDDLIANPNHLTKKLNISDLSAPRELTRREREQKEKKEAKERYWKLHAQGKTDQAKADLSRLAKIREERQAAAAKRKAEAEEKAKVLEAAKAAQSKR
ncbi:casein kinase substrate phosphoprotein PP28-domain-containing protein [Russula aff. rugulosa BPL654]|nr:casein kinase substrate phosphoprotein PP28-domain-containing protein [Russula aff. rugulosa BPL654]